MPTFLSGLEHEHHRAGEVFAPLAKRLGRAYEHGGVGIVAAGVHRARYLRGERQARLLLHGQGVHVAAQKHGAPVAAVGGVSWSPEFGQVAKVGSTERKDGPDDGKAEAIFG